MMKAVKTLFAALLCVAAVGCIRGDQPTPQPSTVGTVDFSMVTLNFADGSSQATDSYQVVVTNPDNQVSASGVLGSLEGVELTEGDYVITVSSMAEAPLADWETPYYVGTANISVERDAISQVGAITAELKNIGVRVEYTERFREMVEDYSVKVTLGLGSLTFSSTETRTGYFCAVAAKQLLTAELTGSVDGKTFTEQRIVRDVMAGDVKLLTFDIKEKEPDEPVTPPVVEPEEGGVDLDFVIDVTVNNVDINGNIIVDENDREPAEDDGEGDEGEGGEGGEGGDTPTIPDGPADLGAPTIVWEGHDLNEWYNLTDGSVQVALNITCPNKIKTLVVDIISDAPAFQPDQLQGLGLDSRLDLSNPGDLRGAIEGLGFPVAENVIGKTELVFDISQFMPLLGIAAEDESVAFQLTLTDDYGHELVVSLKINVNLK